LGFLQNCRALANPFEAGRWLRQCVSARSVWSERGPSHREQSAIAPAHTTSVQERGTGDRGSIRPSARSQNIRAAPGRWAIRGRQASRRDSVSARRIDDIAACG
jgi:hypothetical protein